MIRFSVVARISRRLLVVVTVVVVHSGRTTTTLIHFSHTILHLFIAGYIRSERQADTSWIVVVVVHLPFPVVAVVASNVRTVLGHCPS
jgi:hypothetical protein